jgi:flagellar basal-body rod protein FlgG
MADGQQVGRLRIEQIATTTPLQHEGDGVFTMPDEHEALPDEQRVVQQGAIEGSNVTSVTALVDMIAVQRAYAAVQKTMTTIDQVRGIAATDLAKPV